MPTILFTKTQRVQVPGQPDEVFEAGKEYEVAEASRARWLRRGVAVDPPAAAPASPTRRRRKAKAEGGG